MQSVVALFKDHSDARRWDAYLDGIATVVCLTVGSAEELRVDACAASGSPDLIILSSRLYAEFPAVASRVRALFPRVELLLISSAEEPAPAMPPLLADNMRHVEIAPASADPAARGYFETVLQRLVAGRPWDIGACLAPATPVSCFHPARTGEKEGIIAALEDAIAGSGAHYDLLRQRGALLADELMENAFYGAPRGSDGGRRFRKEEPRPIAREEGIRFRFGFDGEVLALEMEDGWGTLEPERVMAYLAGAPDGMADREQDGGRGLFIIWRFFDHFHVSITPGKKTVVSGDLRLCHQPDPEAPRGFHISTHEKEVQNA